MKNVLIAIGVVIALFVGTLVLTTTPLAGEVVTLHTMGSDGDWQTTPLWAVDEGGHVYVRASEAESGWVLRSRAHPEARLERRGEVVPVRVVIDESARDAVNRRMAEKYGWADDFIGLLGDASISLPLRLEIVEAGS